MLRQYIGARYVPMFSDLNDGEWDNSYTYEPLTIVKYGNDFYTSKIPVPVGVSISDSKYWAKTGDYNGAIATLTGRVEDAEEAVEKLTDEMPQYNTPKGLGVTTDELADMIAALPASQTLVLEQKNYTITKEVVINKPCVIDLNGATLTIDPNFTKDSSVSGQGTRGWAIVITTSGVTIKNGRIDCGNGNDYSNFYSTGTSHLDLVWGMVVRISSVTLSKLTFLNCANNCLTIYYPNIERMKIENCAFLNSCCGIQVETPADLTSPIFSVDVDNCTFNCVAAVNSGSPCTTYTNCTFVRNTANNSYNSSGAALVQAGINDAEVPDGAGSVFISCYIWDNTTNTTPPIVRIYGDNAVSSLPDRGFAKFINCTIKGNRSYPIYNNGIGLFIGCTIFGSIYIDASIQGATFTNVMNCVFKPHVGSTPSAASPVQCVALSGNYSSIHVIAIQGCRNLGGYFTLPSVNAARAPHFVLNITNNIFDKGSVTIDISEVKNSIIVGNRDTSNNNLIAANSISAAVAGTNCDIVDNHSISYT